MLRSPYVLYLASALSFIAVWWAASLLAAAGGHANILPSPATVGGVAVELFREGEVTRHLFLTLGRVFAGEYEVVELPTLEAEHPDGRSVAVNDVVVSSASLGRMIELELAVAGEELGRQPCDGIICSTPSGSTAYNLSNGGPVLMWGIDAMATTFVAPHSLHARPLVVPRGKDVVVWNRTADVPVAVLVDGHRVGEAPPGGRVAVRLGDARTLLATLPDATFVSRYRESFST